MPIEEVSRTFGVWDYVVFGCLFLISALIGVFFAVKAKMSKASADDYLMGGRQMHALPVAFSLTSGFLSAITILGTPSEYYVYGTMFFYFVIPYFLVAIIASELYIPLFYKLNITSTYEYLELRFNRAARYVASTVYILNQVMYIGIVIYAPAIALNEVTGLNIWVSIIVTGVVCTFYTALGGLKAVIWTDVFQCIVMTIGFLAIIIQGSIVMGGFGEIWEIAESRGRIDFVHFEGDPRIRHTFWSLIVGGTFLWGGIYCTTQTVIQRYLCCKSLTHAKVSVYLNAVGITIVGGLAGLAGLTMFGYYANCDPYTAGWVSATDQLAPYFVMELLYATPGLPGVYVCSAFSGTLSTVSSGINAMAAVTLEDYIKPVKKLSPDAELWISKILVVVFGAICLGMAVVAPNLGGILEAAISINGIVSGPMVGLFTMGFGMPWVNSWGAISGVVSGLGVAVWCYVGSTFYPAPSEFTRRLDVSIEDCVFPLENNTITTTALAGTTTIYEEERPPIADMYAMSYLYYGVFGFVVAIIIGNVVSFITGIQKASDLPPGVTIPVFDHPIFCWLPKKVRKFLWCGVDYDRQNDEKNAGFKENGGIENESFKHSEDDVKVNGRIKDEAITRL